MIALLFSWLGDVLLQKESLFVPGLLAFLTAHIFIFSSFKDPVRQNLVLQTKTRHADSSLGLFDRVHVFALAHIGCDENTCLDLRHHHQHHALCSHLAISETGRQNIFVFDHWRCIVCYIRFDSCHQQVQCSV